MPYQAVFTRHAHHHLISRPVTNFQFKTGFTIQVFLANEGKRHHVRRLLVHIIVEQRAKKLRPNDVRFNHTGWHWLCLRRWGGVKSPSLVLICTYHHRAKRRLHSLVEGYTRNQECSNGHFAPLCYNHLLQLQRFDLGCRCQSA